MQDRPIHIELRHLRYFLAVIEELHFGRAAERVHISQPPLSKAIRRLEQELGVELLERTSRVVRPTAAGEAFAHEARAVLSAADRAVAAARRAANVVQPLRVGCIPIAPPDLLQGFLQSLADRDPRLQSEVVHLWAPDQVRRLHSGGLDVAIYTDVQSRDGLVAEPLFAGEPCAAFIAHDDPLTAKDVITPDDVRDRPLVTFPKRLNPELHAWQLRELEAAGYEFAEVLEVGGGAYLGDVVTKVAAGGVVGVLALAVPEMTGTSEIVACRPLWRPLVYPDIVAVWRADLAAPLADLMQTVREVARETRVAQGIKSIAE